MRIDGKAVTENDEAGADTPRRSEQAALPFAARGVDVRIVRPARFVYSEALTTGFIAMLMGIAAQKGMSAYIGAGDNRIHAVNVLDLAELYRLALEAGKNGARYHGVGDGGIAFRDVAAAIGKRLAVPAQSIPPERAAAHFDVLLGAVAGANNPASSEATRSELGWRPAGPSLPAVLGDGPFERF
jgi:nucleoside-diphosphate-sugar epimerase